MSRATVIQCRKGKVDATSIYVLIKNGNVYRFNESVPISQQASFTEKLACKGNIIKLKYWTLVRTKR